MGAVAGVRSNTLDHTTEKKQYTLPEDGERWG